MKYPSVFLLAAIIGINLGGTGLLRAAEIEKVPAHWEPCGWGGGGFYYATVFHPTRDGTIYLAGDVGGVYKSTDHGRNWRMINKGLPAYGVFSLAVDRNQPETVYAATDDGLCKSTDGGENWQVLPQTRLKQLRITGEKNKSIRSVAVDPSDSNTIYAASPAGKVFKSTDGGQAWKVAYAKDGAGADSNRIRVQFGKVDAQYFGGVWIPLKFPAGLAPEAAVGLSVNFKGDKSTPKDFFITLGTGDGLSYRSKNLRDLFADDRARDVILRGADFILDPEYAKKNPEKAAAASATPEWAKVNRLDMSCSGPLPEQAAVASLGSISYAVIKTADGITGTVEAPVRVMGHDFAKNKDLRSYGNIRIGEPAQGSIYSVAVTAKDPSLVIASTDDSGLVLSKDKGATWTALATPRKASSACFDPADPNVIYATFWDDGIWKSTDQGKTWKKLSEKLPPTVSYREVTVSPSNSLDVYAIGQNGWNGSFYLSNDGGATWKSSTNVIADYAGDPTLPAAGADTPLSIPTNVAINPLNPKQLYLSVNWRSCFSEDGGLTWHERMKGADISCITDIRFSGKKTYATVMDEGTLMSEDHGKNWKQLWPLKYSAELSGHNWRVAVNNIGGTDRIIATASPWDKFPNRVVVSEDAGKTYQVITDGLPDYISTANTMWGRGYARALAVDPSNPKIVYLGLDGDPADGNNGGGVFKSEDGGHHWKQLSTQPGSRRMYYGLAIDPTNTQRIYWGGFGDKGGVYRSEDGGGSWQSVFTNDLYVFNVMTTADGTVYVSGKNLWRSVDKGKTWSQISRFDNNCSIVGLEVHPSDPKTIWISSTVWSGDAEGGIYKTTDGGVTWKEITGDTQFIRPQILRFNPATNELWAGYVGLFKLKQ
ncbi:MAG: hypothetical protein V4689_10070 [Verrucomicrobiota bacterium]